jgi:DNA polymerase-3 subunit alpha
VEEAQAEKEINPELYPEIEEWAANQLLAFEKESLGFYITGHPLDKYEKAVKKLTTGTAVQLRERPSSAEVKAAGVVTALKLKNTKKGDRYASFNLEDKTGFIEVIVWPDVYRRSHETIVLDDPILVTGRLDVGEERIQLIAKDVSSLDGVVARSKSTSRPKVKSDEGHAAEQTHEIHFFIRSPDLEPRELSRLHEMFLQYRGTCTVFLHLFKPDRSETIIELPDRLKVNPSRNLLEAVDRAFGRRITASLNSLEAHIP